MVKNKITIHIPKTKNQKWSVRKTKGGGFFRKTGKNTFSALTRLLSSNCKASKKESWGILVVYPDGGKNQTLYSTDKNYLLFAAACFLEDYISKATLRRIERDYLLSTKSACGGNLESPPSHKPLL